MSRLRELMAQWARGNGAPPPSGAPTTPPEGIYRDPRTGRVYVRQPPAAERLTWPEDVPEAEPPTRAHGVPIAAWGAIGWRAPGTLDWRAGTVLYLAGERLPGLTLARWLATRLAERADTSPVRVLSARSLPAESWTATPGPERSLFVTDIAPHLGAKRLRQVVELITARERRSVVLVGEPIGVGDEWAGIVSALRADGARKVQV